MQAMVESLLSEYPNVLVLRVRMPIVEDLLYPRNFITKIIKYEKVIACLRPQCWDLLHPRNSILSNLMWPDLCQP
jgi:hypothetical protein